MEIDTYVIEPITGGVADVLAKEGLLSLEQIAYALRVKGKLAGRTSLLDVINDLGYVSRDAMRQQLRKSIGSLCLGPVLVDLGLLSREWLDTAVTQQQTVLAGKSMIELLAMEGVVAEQAIGETLAALFGIKLVDLAFRELDPDLCAMMPAEVCRHHSCIPVGREHDQILVAFADPLDAGSRGAAVKYLGKQIVAAVTTRQSILAALARLEQPAGAALTKDSTQLALMVAAATAIGARTIHLEPLPDRLRVRFRRDGMLTTYTEYPLEAEQHFLAHLQNFVATEGNVGAADRLRVAAADGSTHEVRLSRSTTLLGETIVLHLLNRLELVPELAELGMAPRVLDRFIYDSLESPNGMVLIIGPPGAGKTTTLYSAISHLHTASASIMTIEDHPSYTFAGVAQHEADQGSGETPAELLMTIARHEPDLIAVDTAGNEGMMECSSRLALAGHKQLLTYVGEETMSVLSLLLADREPFLVATAVNSLLAQRLVRAICGECAKPYIPSPQELSRIGLSQEFLHGARFMAGQGCKACQYSGFKGRVALFELLLCNEPVREAIIARKGSAEILRISRETAGFVSLFEDGLVKAARGQIHVRDLIRYLPRTGRPRPVNELQRILGDHQ